MTASPITPVTLLTGYLGSGKTTLLNRLLADPAMEQTAVLINEFGAVSIDHLLVREASENIMVLSNGCLCCSVAGDMVQALRELYFKRANGEVPPFSRVMIETTGLAEPAPILRTLIEMPLVAARYAPGIVTTVDAERRSPANASMQSVTGRGGGPADHHQDRAGRAGSSCRASRPAAVTESGCDRVQRHFRRHRPLGLVRYRPLPARPDLAQHRTLAGG
jgi:G3E family GTPase